MNVREAVIEREKGRCAVCGLAVDAMGQKGHIHHRKPRGMGGSKALDILSNLVYLHATCHLKHVESNRERSYQNGWLVRRSDYPGAVPFVYMLDRKVLLKDDGTIMELQPKEQPQ